MLHSQQCRHAKMQNNMISMRKREHRPMLVVMQHACWCSYLTKIHLLLLVSPITYVLLCVLEIWFRFFPPSLTHLFSFESYITLHTRQVLQLTVPYEIVTPLSMSNRKILLLLSNYVFSYRYVKTLGHWSLLMGDLGIHHFRLGPDSALFSSKDVSPWFDKC